MPKKLLQTLELLEETAARQLAELEEILALVEATHPAFEPLTKAVHDARDRQRALDRAWKSAAESLADDRR